MLISINTGRKPGRPAAAITNQEALILEVLRGNIATHGTEIARRAGIPTTGIYTLLRRLEDKQLIERIKTTVNFGDTPMRRVVYKIKQ